MKTNKAMAVPEQGRFPLDGGFSQQQLLITLPLKDLVAVFEHEMREFLAYDSFEYEHGASATHYSRGTPRLHKCQYHIQASGLELGRLILTRRKPFQEEELLVVERALGALSIHLNNALDYQSNLDQDQLTELQVDQLAN